jgi:hypothetical protein
VNETLGSAQLGMDMVAMLNGRYTNMSVRVIRRIAAPWLPETIMRNEYDEIWPIFYS